MKELLEEKWSEVLDFLLHIMNINEVSYKLWILPLRISAVTENTVIFSCDDSLSCNSSFLTSRYGNLIRTAIAEVTGLDLTPEFVFQSTDKNDRSNSANSVSGEAKANTLTPEQAKAKARKQALKLNPAYTFSTFVVGENNNMAYNTALATAEAPAQQYNPLFIYGGVGLGKTHLLQSIADFIIDTFPHLEVMYVTSEKFTNELIESIRNSSSSAFRDTYRNIDVLLIDDIQFIIGKERTQEEFFHTFNALRESGKQVIISSDKPPKEFKTLEERLRSRFESGLTVDIQLPQYETKVAILRSKVQREGQMIDDKILEYIASHINSNIRELEGALNKVVAFSRIMKKEISLSLAEDALKDCISSGNRRIITVDFIVDIVADHYKVTPEDLFSSDRRSNFVLPRQIAMYLCRDYTSFSLAEIGNKIGGRDHSTVLHGIKKIEDLMKQPNNEQLMNNIDILIKKINPQTETDV